MLNLTQKILTKMKLTPKPPVMLTLALSSQVWMGFFSWFLMGCKTFFSIFVKKQFYWLFCLFWSQLKNTDKNEANTKASSNVEISRVLLLHQLRKPHKISTHSAYSENVYFQFFYWLSDWVEILWGFTKFFLKQMLKISAFCYLEKQKRFYF